MYHLGRELPLHVGGIGRFANTDEHDAFVAQVEAHCREAAAVRPVVRRWCRPWGSRPPTSPRPAGSPPGAWTGWPPRSGTSRGRPWPSPPNWSCAAASPRPAARPAAYPRSP